MLVSGSGREIERILAYWYAENPSFVWIPTDGKYQLLDRISGYVGRPAGSNLLAAGGQRNIVANNSTNWIRWDTNARITTGTTQWIGMALVSVDNPSSVTGAVVKIGSTANGLGYGGGNTTFENSGTKMVTLVEGISWGTPAGSWAQGLNAVTFGWSSDSHTRMNNVTTGTNSAFFRSGGYNTPSAQMYVSGYFTNRGTNMRVHAVAVFPRQLSGTEFDSESNRLGEKMRPLFRAPKEHVYSLFERDAQIVVPVTAGGSDVSVNGTPDSLTITEQSATVQVSTIVEASIDALVIVEQAATVALNVIIPATQDSLAITESSANVDLNVVVSATNDTLAITEQSATVQVGSNISVIGSPDSLVITEQSATVFENVTVSATPQALIITEQTGSVIQDISIPASPDSLIITESAATVSAPVSVIASPDSLIITSAIASVSDGLATASVGSASRASRKYQRTEPIGNRSRRSNL